MFVLFNFFQNFEKFKNLEKFENFEKFKHFENSKILKNSKNLKNSRILKILKFMHTAKASELKQNTLSSVCPVLATVVPQLHSFFVFYPDLLLKVIRTIHES